MVPVQARKQFLTLLEAFVLDKSNYVPSSQFKLVLRFVRCFHFANFQFPEPILLRGSSIFEQIYFKINNLAGTAFGLLLLFKHTIVIQKKRLAEPQQIASNELYLIKF